MDTTPLKPCPFCGSEVTIDHDDGLSFFRCAAGSTCAGSGLIAFCATEQVVTAIAAWNTRAALKAQLSGVVLPERKAEPNPTWAAAPHVGRPLNAEEITEARAYNSALEARAYNSALNEVAYLNQPASAGDERAAFIRDFKLDGKIYYDENTRQWLPARDSMEGFNLAQRVTACWVGWQARAALSANHSEQAPEDWQLVPVEPTVAMQAAALRHVMRQHTLRDIWKDMLAAAAAPSAGSQEKDHGL